MPGAGRVAYAPAGDMEELQRQFVEWVSWQGEVPDFLQGNLPQLERSVDGEWRWNRNTDDPTPGKRTCLPINRFSWHWLDAETLQVTNHINRKGGDSEEKVMLKLVNT